MKQLRLRKVNAFTTKRASNTCLPICYSRFSTLRISKTSAKKLNSSPSLSLKLTLISIAFSFPEADECQDEV